MGSRRGSVSSRRFVATFMGWTMVTSAVTAVVTAAIRRHLVVSSPATIDDTRGFIVIRPNVTAVVVSVFATNDASGQ
ncbi:MAG: hypothetical protein WA666_13590 [Nitrospirota bacterium]